MDLTQRKIAFVQLGEKIKSLDEAAKQKLYADAETYNGWFTKENVAEALQGITFMLKPEKLDKWLENYAIEKTDPKKVGLIMAGNLPAVGFHDLLCVLISGHEAHIKLSSEDQVVPRFIINLLLVLEPEFSPFIHIRENLKKIDAVIATGSDNSARYFEYYFSKIPRIIRKNRTSIAILNGNESEAELNALGKDIFTYFGLGCRNVSKIFIPSGYDLGNVFEGVFSFGDVINNRKYANNYDYNRAIYLMNSEKFLDNNFLMMRETTDLFSPVSVLFYQQYQNIDQVLDYINENAEKLQCIVTRDPSGNEIKIGETQKPELWNYADNVDTMAFLLQL